MRRQARFIAFSRKWAAGSNFHDLRPSRWKKPDIQRKKEGLGLSGWAWGHAPHRGSALVQDGAGLERFARLSLPLAVRHPVQSEAAQKACLIPTPEQRSKQLVSFAVG